MLLIRVAACLSLCLIDNYNVMVLPVIPNFITKLFPALLWKMPNEYKVVYLTFDDGPVPEATPWVLDLLDKYQIKASFFCVGDNVRKHPHIYQDILRKGHSVGNHTFNHLNAFSTKAPDYFNNIEKASTYINSNLFRPPRGFIRKAHYKLLKHKYRAVMWTVLSVDYDKNVKVEKCIKNVVDNVSSGSIIVFHDSIKAWKNMHQALPKVIENLLFRGFKFKAMPYDTIHK